MTGSRATRLRVPNRREPRSLICHQNKRPALPSEHPFINLFHGWSWSSTTAVISPAHAWYVSMDGGCMFYGGKDQSFMVWPVRGPGNGVLPATGQTGCYNDMGAPIPCAGTGQDGEPNDCRFLNINELESLVNCSAYDPALSRAHPFRGVQDLYWSASTSLFEPDWAWALYMSKGAMGVGRKQNAHFCVWAVHD